MNVRKLCLVLALVAISTAAGPAEAMLLPASPDACASVGPRQSSSGNDTRLRRPRRKFSERLETIRISHPPNASGFCSVPRLD
jgi:hypothetical protein